MLIILYQHGCQNVAKKVASDLNKAFADHVKVRLVAASSSSSWPAAASWDDLLIVMYNGKDFPATGNSFIAQYFKERPSSAILLPVAIDPAAKSPQTQQRSLRLLNIMPRLKDQLAGW